jgi:hypothetical protein
MEMGELEAAVGRQGGRGGLLAEEDRGGGGWGRRRMGWEARGQWWAGEGASTGFKARWQCGGWRRKWYRGPRVEKEGALVGWGLAVGDDVDG